MVLSTLQNSTTSSTHILPETIPPQHRRSPLAPSKRENPSASKVPPSAHSSSLSLPLIEPPTSPTRALSPIVGGAAVAMKRLLMRRGRPMPGINSVAPTSTTITEDDRLTNLNESLERTRLSPSVQAFFMVSGHGTDLGSAVQDLDVFESPCQSPAYTISSLDGCQGSFQSPSIASQDNSPLSTPTGTLTGTRVGRSVSTANICRRSFEQPRADSLLELYIENQGLSGQNFKRRSTPVDCKAQPQMVMDEISTILNPALYTPNPCSLTSDGQNLSSVETANEDKELQKLENHSSLSPLDKDKPSQTPIPSPAMSRPIGSSNVNRKPIEASKDGQQSQSKTKPRSCATRQARPSQQEQNKLYENSVAFLAMYHTGSFAVEKIDQRKPKPKKESRRLSTGIERKEMSQKFSRRQSESCILTKVVRHVREGSRDVAMEANMGHTNPEVDSLIGQRSSTSSRSDGTVVISCRASPTQFYDAQNTRSALRLFLIKDGPEFDDLIEFGFPAETFLEDVSHEEEKADQNASELNDFDEDPVSNPPSQQQERRFMTLRVTLTPWHARADESALYGSMRKSIGSQEIMPDAEMLDTQPQGTLLSPSLLIDEDDKYSSPESSRPLSATTMPEIGANRQLSPYSTLDFNRSESCLKLSCLDPQDPFSHYSTECNSSGEGVIIPPRTFSIADMEATIDSRRTRSRTQSSSSASTPPTLRSHTYSSLRMGLVSPPGSSISSGTSTSPPLTPSSWSSPSLASFAHQLNPTLPPLYYHQPRSRKESSSTWSATTESVDDEQGPQASYPSPPVSQDTIAESGRKLLASTMFFSDASSIGNGSSPKRRPQPIPIPTIPSPPNIWDVSVHPLDGSIPPSPSPAMASSFARSTSLNALAFQGGPFSVSPSPSRSHFAQSYAQTHGGAVGRQEYVPPSVRAGPRRPSAPQSPNRRGEDHGVTNGNAGYSAGALSPPIRVEGPRGQSSPTTSPALPRVSHRYPACQPRRQDESDSFLPILSPSSRSPRQAPIVESEPIHREVIFETSEKVILNARRVGGHHSAEIYVGRSHDLEANGVETNHGEVGQYPMSYSTPASPLTATMSGRPWNSGSKSVNSVRAPGSTRLMHPPGRTTGLEADKSLKAELEIFGCYQNVGSMAQQGEKSTNELDLGTTVKEEAHAVREEEEEERQVIVQGTRRLSISRPPKPIVLDHLPPSPSLIPYNRSVWNRDLDLKSPVSTLTAACSDTAADISMAVVNGPVTQRGRSLVKNQRKRGGIVGGPFDGPVGEGMDMGKEEVECEHSPKEIQQDHHQSPSLEPVEIDDRSKWTAPLMEQPSNSVIFVRRRIEIPPTMTHVIKAIDFP